MSKYLNSNYSSKTKRVKDYIIKNRLNEDILSSIVNRKRKARGTCQEGRSTTA